MDELTPTPEALVYDPNAYVVVRNVYETPIKVPAHEVEYLTKELDRVKAVVADYSRKIANVEEYLNDNLEELDEHATEIADKLGIDLTKEVEVTISVEITATVRIPASKDVEDLKYDFDVTLDSNDYEVEIEDYNAEVTSVEE